MAKETGYFVQGVTTPSLDYCLEAATAILQNDDSKIAKPRGMAHHNCIADFGSQKAQVLAYYPIKSLKKKKKRYKNTQELNCVPWGETDPKVQKWTQLEETILC